MEASCSADMRWHCFLEHYYALIFQRKEKPSFESFYYTDARMKRVDGEKVEGLKFGPVITGVKHLADVVGRSVMNTYYRSIINNKEKPWCMSYCYRDESSIMHIDGEKVETASGLEQIEKFVMFPNVSKIEIKRFKATHFIDSREGGVVLVVGGGFLHTTANVARRRFMQIFFFAAEYYIINDVLQFLEEEQHMNQVVEDLLPEIAALEFCIPLLPAENVTDIPQHQQTCAESSDRSIEETLMEKHPAVTPEEPVGENPNPIDPGSSSRRTSDLCFHC